MNNDLLKNNYLIVPNFIDKIEAETLKKEFEITDKFFEFSSDIQAPNSSSVYNYLPALELLANKTSHVSEIVGETVLPTYVYSRIYRNGSILKKHTDRPSCEVSLTLHLGGDKPWAIWIKTPQGENRCVNLNPGDAMVYLGCVAPHWRDEFEGTNYTQFFLHYVRSRGCYSSVYFDKDVDSVDESRDFLEEEYEKMGRVITPNRWNEKQKNNDCDDFELVNPDEIEYVDFDDALIVNKKYEPLLSKTTEKLEVSSNSKLSQKKLDDFILHIKNFIDPEFCDAVLDEYVETNLWDVTLTGSGHDPYARKCQFICISDHSVKEECNTEVRNELDQYLFERVAELIEKYREIHSEFDIEIEEDTGYELLKYEVGDFFVQHTDSFKENPRALTVIFALNDAYKGGELAFFNREKIYRLDVGDVIIFPSNFMYPHEIIPVTEGTRFSIITWIV